MSRNDSDVSSRQASLPFLASGVGHHLINALSAVVSHAELLRIADQSGRTVDPKIVADSVIQSALDAALVARRLIEYTRPLTKPALRPVDLPNLFETEARRLINHAAPGLELVCRWDVPLIVHGCPDQLGLMASCVVANALESMGGRPGVVRLRTFLDDSWRTTLEVADEGEGMAPEVVEHSLEPFFSTKPDRMGIGLTVAHAIWRRHQGTMQVDSTPRKGTRVGFTAVGTQGEAESGEYLMPRS